MKSAFRSRPSIQVGLLARWRLAAWIVLLVLGVGSRTALAAPRYTTAPAFGGVVFDQPVEVVFAPGETRRVFVAERKGTIAIVRDLANPRRDIFLDLRSRLGAIGDDHGLLSVTFHPQFATNGWFYVWYSLQQGSQRSMQLARFTATGAARDQVRLDSEYPLITQATGPGGHDGGQLTFGPDGYLYLSVGDGDVGADPEAAASQQRIDRSFFGAILRLDVDHRSGNLTPHPHPAVHTGAYRVPADNPFVGATAFNGAPVDPARVRSEFWAVGLRNPFRITFDPANGQLWAADVGLDQRDEIDLIEAGRNYGWPFREGTVAGPRESPPDVSTAFIDPIWDYSPAVGRSITGGVVYRGHRFPDLVGYYLFGDFLSGRVWALRPGDPEPTELLSGQTGLVALTVDPRQGDVLFVNLFTGRISRLALNDIGPRLINLSARARVGSGDNVLIPGFVIQGGSKTVLIRALGPVIAEPPFNVPGTLAEPRIHLYRGAQPLDSNAGWTTAPDVAALRATMQRTGAYPLPEFSRDAALVATLPAGLYSVVTSGMDGATGVATVEVYDADESAGPGRLINTSVRAET